MDMCIFLGAITFTQNWLKIGNKESFPHYKILIHGNANYYYIEPCSNLAYFLEIVKMI